MTWRQAILSMALWLLAVPAAVALTAAVMIAAQHLAQK